MRGIIAHCAPWICAPLFEQRLVVFLLRDLAALVPLIQAFLPIDVRSGIVLATREREQEENDRGGTAGTHGFETLIDGAPVWRISAPRAAHLAGASDAGAAGHVSRYARFNLMHKIFILNALSMAVRQGFEPWVPFKGYNALAKRRFRPLSHLTMRFIFLQRARNLIADSRSGKRFSPACCAGEAKKGSRRASKIGECWIPQHARVVFLAVRRGWQANLKIQRGSRVRWREEPRLAAHRERQCRSWRAA